MIDLLLKDKVALITGASRGLGKSIAERYWDAGAILYLVARSTEELSKMAHLLNNKKICSSQKIVLMPGDVTDELFTISVKNHIEQERGHLDILVNNAAMHGPIGPIWENDWTLWKKAFDVDLLAPVFWSRCLLPLLQQSNHGKIINVSGGGATSSRPNFTAYALAKTALVRFTEIVSEELQGSIDVNAISPGVMKTELLSEILKEGEGKSGAKDFAVAKKAVENNSVDESMRLATELALFLASSASNGITGKLISAKWDNWREFDNHRDELSTTDIYTLRRIVPKDRGMDWE